ERRGLFPFSSRAADGRLVNDYDHPIAVRYTINSLLGLSAAATAGLVPADEVEAMTSVFLAGNAARIESVADVGLLLHLLAVSPGEGVASTVGRLDAEIERTRRGRLTMQDLAWATWGLARAARAGDERAGAVGRRTLELVRHDFVEPSSGLPRHSVRRYRRGLVSFGALVYYLRALDEAAAFLGDEAAERDFRAGVGYALRLPGPLGQR